jgi:8-oxo-dGTP diphosphatase
VDPEDMDPDTFPAADRPIIAALRLPALYLITGSDPHDPVAFLARLSRALEGGIRLVQLRAHRLDDAAYMRLAADVYGICEQSGARLLLNRDPDFVRDLPCHGLHLTSSRLAGLVQRPLNDERLVGASCHDADDLERAADLGLDYALLSPVNPTASHPDTPLLGWDRFAALADRAAIPVYALGGLGPRDLGRAFRRCAQGVAAISGLWPD